MTSSFSFPEHLFGVPCPLRLLDLERIGVENLEAISAGNGYSVGYKAEGLDLTIYIYGEVSSDIALDEVTAAKWAEHFQQCVADVSAADERLGRQSELINRHLRGAGDTAREFLGAFFVLKHTHVDVLSLMLLARFNGKYVKLRMTSDRDFETASSAMENVCSEFSNKLWPGRGEGWTKLITGQAVT